jgi:hypothetical protein
MGLEAQRRSKLKTYPTALEPASPRTQLVLNEEYSRSEAVPAHAYSSINRSLEKEGLASSRFAARFRAGQRHNALFPHYCEEGQYSDSEIKNRGFIGLSPVGEKGLWSSNQTRENKYLVICESAIDRLAIMRFFRTSTPTLGFIPDTSAPGCGLSPRTPALLN